MKCSYTNFETIGIMTLEEATEYINRREIWSKEAGTNAEYELNIQCTTTTKKGLLMLEENTNKYHFLHLKADELKGRQINFIHPLMSI